MMANSGGARDNAKQCIEAGRYGGKDSDSHKAAAAGEAIDDSFKDAQDPINRLTRLPFMVSIVFAPSY